MRVNVTLNDEESALLVQLAEAAHVQPGTLARSLLLTAMSRSARVIEQDPDSDITAILDAIPGAHAAIARGRAEIAAGNSVPLDQLP